MNKAMTVDEYFNTVCPNTRIRNALVRGGIVTMAQVCAMPEEKLMRVRNFGFKSLDIILGERRKYLAGDNTPG